MERLLHYSAEPLAAVHSSEQDKASRPFKPAGLWVSVEGEDDWKSWCEAEEFCLNRLAHITEVILTPQANILRLTNDDEIRKFSEQYAFGYMKISDFRMAVHWEQVAELYQGIIIAPYSYRVRMDNDCFWYYTWDCASGCIWDASAIAALVPVQASVCAK